jgi:radical SAM family uncharacterized protein/radical SAM-linked protein
MNFAHFQKPSRYINTEYNAVHKDQLPREHVRMALAFPDVYEVGMSHLGLRILYDIVNALPYAAAERVFAPWPDLQAHLTAADLPLASLETHRPLAEFDVVGFSLQYELSYTTVLSMLDAAKIPLTAEERRASKRGLPLVIAGGPCAVNPAPMERFIDAFLIGDGEEAVVEIVSTIHAGKQSGDHSRESLLHALSQIPGVYVPEIHRHDCRVMRRVVADLDHAPFPVKPVVPYMQIVHDRIAIEISRGCTHGCRFCQAGMMYRPMRERSPETILRIAQDSIRNTGHGEVSLSSLSAGDYSGLLQLVTSMNRCFRGTGTALALPSLRVGAVNRAVLREIRSVRKTGFTMAPEAATERLRAVINKDFTDDAYEAALLALFSEGWQTLKLYFMIGLPTETDSDIAAIGEMAMRALRMAKKQSGKFVNINITVSPFVPKPHTAFQWNGQEPLDEIRRKLSWLRSDMQGRRFKYKGHDPETSFLEAVFSRGDASLGRLIEEAWRLGCRLDGWSEHFDFAKWQRAMEATGIDGAQYAQRQFAIDEPLPWDMIDIGVSKSFLRSEHERAYTASMTPECRTACSACGLQCASAGDVVTLPPASVPALQCSGAIPSRQTPDARVRIRVRFSKTGRLRFLSHLELMTAITRALRRANIPVAVSEGFHPKPILAFGPPLGTGVAGEREFFDMDVLTPFQTEWGLNALNAAFPGGLAVSAMELIPRQEPSLGGSIKRYSYRISGAKDLLPGMKEKIDARDPILSERDGKPVDIGPCIADVSQSGDDFMLVVQETDGVTVRLQEMCSVLFGMPLQDLEVTRTAVYSWKQEWAEPL